MKKKILMFIMAICLITMPILTGCTASQTVQDQDSITKEQAFGMFVEAEYNLMFNLGEARGNLQIFDRSYYNDGHQSSTNVICYNTDDGKKVVVFNNSYLFYFDGFGTYQVNSIDLDEQYRYKIRFIYGSAEDLLENVVKNFGNGYIDYWNDFDKYEFTLNDITKFYQTQDGNCHITFVKRSAQDEITKIEAEIDKNGRLIRKTIYSGYNSVGGNVATLGPKNQIDYSYNTVNVEEITAILANAMAAETDKIIDLANE